MADRRGAAIVEAMNAGCTLNDIGTFLGITREGVRSTARKYARRNDLPRPRRPLAPDLWVCQECGALMNEKKLLCSEECRVARRARWGMDKKATKYVEDLFTCHGCGKEFWRTRNLQNIHNSLGCKNTYCTHECYHANHWRMRREAANRRGV